ncbi:MAG: tetratricopeptide repeat protein [Desulfobacterales bacterium]|nr:tetratricopeptide repeat protein [Desulfobacterales bacterium]
MDRADSARMEASELTPLFYYHAALTVGKKMVNGILDVYNGIFGIGAEDRARIYRNISTHYLKKGQYAKAVNSLKEWARLEPDNTAPLFELARAMVKSGKFKPAVNVYAKILAREPENIEALYAQTRLFFKRKEFEKALVENVPRLEKTAPANPDVLYLVAMVYSRTDRLEKAIETLQRAIELNEDEIRYHQNLGFLYERLGKNEEAARCFSRVMELEDEEYEDG